MGACIEKFIEQIEGRGHRMHEIVDNQKSQFKVGMGNASLAEDVSGMQGRRAEVI